jgi:phytoene dehydrogenase-like protein
LFPPLFHACLYDKERLFFFNVPTPVTYVRYAGNWQGSPDGWYITPQNLIKQKPVRSLEGLEGLYTVGQWTAPFTGTVMAALTGRQLIQILCAKEGREFKTSCEDT